MIRLKINKQYKQNKRKVYNKKLHRKKIQKMSNLKIINHLQDLQKCKQDTLLQKKSKKQIKQINNSQLTGNNIQLLEK